MSLIDIKNQYDIAIDGQGFMLRGTPESPRYRCNQGTIFNQRFAQGDRSYEDFSQFWFTRQTDWFQGFKDDKSWADDGKFYLSSNIDTSDEIGVIKLHKGHDGSVGTTISQNITCGSDGLVSADSGKFIGTDNDSANSYPYVWKEGDPSWTNMQYTTDTRLDYISQLFLRSEILWGASAIDNDTDISGLGTTTEVLKYNTDGVANNWTDVSSHLSGLLEPYAQTGSPNYERIDSCTCMTNYQDTMYVGLNSSKRSDRTKRKYHIVLTAEEEPDAENDWEHVLSGSDFKIISIVEFGGSIYYLLYNPSNTRAEFWKYDIAATEATIITNFSNTNYNHYYNTNKYLFTLYGKIIIVVPDNEIWSYDGSVLERIYFKDVTKASLGNEYTSSLYYGGQVIGDKAYFVNLIYDGTNFHNWIKDPLDSADAKFYPLFVTTDNKWYGSTSGVPKTLYGLGTASYKGTEDQNFLFMNMLDVVSGVDKTAFHVDIIFNKLQENEKIKISYTTDELDSNTTWTELGDVNYTDDGGTITKQRLPFPSNVEFRKIWFKIDLEGDGSSTPKLNDMIFAYLPKANPDAVWTMTINCADYVESLAGERSSKTGRELKEKLWLLLRNQETIDFQDINYASTTLTSELGTSDTTMNVASTDEFPEQGRLVIGDTVYYYTGKTQTSFTGLTQGEKDTQAVTQANGSTVHNGYKVVMQSIDTVQPTGYRNSTRQTEYDVQISLREIR